MRKKGMVNAAGHSINKMLIVLVFVWILLLAGTALAERASHMDSFKNRKGCAACHGGSGVPGTPLLKASRERICFNCHGSFTEGGAITDIERVFNKESIHPVKETSRFHIRGEALPERQESIPRHVSCFDCHVVHLSTPGIPWKGARGYLPSLAGNTRETGLPPTGLTIRRAEQEYELCYMCHSESTNLPAEARDISLEFNPSNFSYHPVELPGKNFRVPSLVRSLNVASKIRCTDCHGNDDVMGPRGPHGSMYKPLLVARYRTEDGPEEAQEYGLCYMCHDRRSILGDESFKSHKSHVVAQNTSCFTCHASHGSKMEHLISFNELVVEPSATGGGPTYMPSGNGTPRCFLTCHLVDHSDTDVGGNPWPY